MKNKNLRPVHMRIPEELLTEIKEFQKESNKDSLTDAMIELLQLAMRVVETKGKLKEPMLVEQMRRMYITGRLVDWFDELDERQTEAVFGALWSHRVVKYNRKNVPSSIWGF